MVEFIVRLDKGSFTNECCLMKIHGSSIDMNDNGKRHSALHRLLCALCLLLEQKNFSRDSSIQPDIFCKFELCNFDYDQTYNIIEAMLVNQSRYSKLSN